MPPSRSQRLRDLLARPSAVGPIVAVALALAAPCLWSPLIADDDIQWIRFSPDRSYPGFDAPRFDFFVFASGKAEDRKALMEDGVFGWWTAEGVQVAFWRPLSAVTHALDFELWGQSSVPLHVHSLLWFAALNVATALLYRRLHVAWVATLATALYAFDDARGMVVSFVANRNALIAGVLGVATLLAHDRSCRDGWRPGSVVAAVLYALALLAGESAVATLGYLVSYALFLDPAPWRRRALRLAPYAAVTAAWGAVYAWLGYGVHGCGMYVHPQSDPGRFLMSAVQHAPVLLLGQVAGVPSDLWLLTPRPYDLLYWSTAVGVLVSLAAVLRPLFRESAVVRFWSVGALLCLVPICATFPSDRLLVFVGIGAMGVLAELLARAFGGDASLSRPARFAAAALAVVNLVAAPMALPVRARTVDMLGDACARIDRSVPADPSVSGKTIVAASVPIDGFLGYTTIKRAALGQPRPARFRILATGIAGMQITRVDAVTLRVRPERGFLSTRIESMLRDSSEPMRAGERVALSDVDVLVNTVDGSGRPTEAEFRFHRPLEDPSFLWRRWEASSLVPWQPPAVGTTEFLPAIDPFRVLTP